MTQAKTIVKDSTIYTFGTVISQVIGIATSIAMRRFLTPEMMGIWTTFLVVLNYSLFAELGIFTALEVKIPYLRGKNINDDIQKIRDTAFTFAAAISFIIILILLAASFILKGKTPDSVVLGIRVISLIIAATFFYNLYVVMLRADKKFFLLTKMVVFNSLVTLLFVASLTYAFKLKGIYFATLFATAASLIYIKFSAKYSLKLYFNADLARSLYKIGLPIFVAGLMYTVFLSVDKIMIIRMIGAKELGFYSIAILALTYTQSFPKLFSIVLFPTMQEEFGKSDSRERILSYIKKAIFIMAYALPALLILAYFGIPVLVHYILPKYTLGIDSMKILLFGCFFLSLVPLTQNFILTINKQLVLIPISILAVACSTIINYIIIKIGYGITGVALGTSASYFIYFMVMFFYISLQCEKWRAVMASFLRICFPLIYSLITVIVLEYFMKTGSPIMRSVLQICIFYVVYTPVLLYAENKTNIFSKFIKRKNKKAQTERTLFSDIHIEE